MEGGGLPNILELESGNLQASLKICLFGAEKLLNVSLRANLTVFAFCNWLLVNVSLNCI